MRPILIIDTETTGLDPSTSRLVEVACAVYSIEHRALIRARSWLIAGDTNEAEPVNGISPELLKHGVPVEDVMRQVYGIAIKECEAVVAHHAAFDRKWFSPEIQLLPWACSCHDMQWPRYSSSRSLTSLALAHGVGVIAAHRALDDVLTLARLFDRAAELGADIPTMIARAMRPKSRFVADAPRSMNDVLKAHSFCWDSIRREWWRRMPDEEAQHLPFTVRKAEPQE